MRKKYAMSIAAVVALCATMWAGSDSLKWVVGEETYKVWVDKVKSISFVKGDGADFSVMKLLLNDDTSKEIAISTETTVEYVHGAAPTVSVALTPNEGTVSAKFTPSEEAVSYKYSTELYKTDSLAGKTNAELIALINDNGKENTEAAEATIAVPGTFNYGDSVSVLAVGIDAGGEYGEPVQSVFRVVGPYVDIAVKEVKPTSASVTFTPSAKINKYYFYWCGPTSSLADCTYDLSTATADYIKWIGTNKPGGARPYWAKASEDEDFTGLTPSTEYTIIAVPVTKKSGYVVNGPVVTATFTTGSNTEVPAAEITITDVTGDAYYTTAKYTMNSAGTKFYALCMNDSEWQDYIKAHADKTVAEILVENGASYSSSRTVTWKTPSETTVRLLAVAVNELDSVSEVADVTFKTPAKELGSAKVDITVSEVTATTARVICTPSADTKYYMQKEAYLSQWDDIAATNDGGIYDYVVYNGYKLSGVDDYTFQGLLSEKTHKIYCVAVDTVGKYSRMTEAVFSPKEEAGEDSEAYEQYVGTWNMSYTDWVTKETGTLTVTITPRVVGKSYNVSGLVTPAIVSSWEITDQSLEGRFEDGKLLLYCGKYMEEIGQKMRNNGYDAVQFCGFSKGTDSEMPKAFTNSSAAILLTRDGDSLTFSTNGYYTGKNELQGYCWMTTSNGDTSGRLDTVIPIGLSFAKVATDATTTTAVKAPESKVSVRTCVAQDYLTGYDEVATGRVENDEAQPMSHLK